MTAEIGAVDEARHYAQLADHGLTVAQIADQVGARPRMVRERLQLLQLTDDTLERIRSGRLPVQAALDAIRTVGAAGQIVATLAVRPAAVGKPWFGPGHRLAEQARIECDEADHDGPGDLLGGVACGPCWETTIRAAVLHSELFGALDDAEALDDDAVGGSAAERSLEVAR